MTNEQRPVATWIFPSFVAGLVFSGTRIRMMFTPAPKPVYVPWATPGGRSGSPEHLRAIRLAAARGEKAA